MQEVNTTTKETILVTGATGHLGTAVVGQLLQKISASQIIAFARDEEKAAKFKQDGVIVRLGDFDDRSSLERAMQGVGKVLLVSGTDEKKSLQQHKDVVDAAKSAGVQTLAYTSRSLKDRTTLENRLMDRHFETEDYIRESGLDYILFRNSLYMDTIPIFVGPQVLDVGILLPAGGGKVAYALRSEQGEAIANVLASGADANKIYHFTGNEAWSFADVATTLSTLAGKTVTYTPVEKSDFEVQMKERGLPEPVIQRIVDFMSDIKNGQEEEVTLDLETWLERKPASLKEGLKFLFHL